MDSYNISASAMSAQRLRLDVISSNLANINTTRQADGTLGAYRRHNVVFAPIMSQQMGFGGGSAMTSSQTLAMAPSTTAQDGQLTIHAGVQQNVGYGGAGVQVVQVAEDENAPLRKVYDPTHPDADKDGYVSYPNINPVTEMVDMISASRAYEANVSAFQASKSMDKSALEI